MSAWGTYLQAGSGSLQPSPSASPLALRISAPVIGPRKYAIAHRG